jgi:hypothetical protein
MEAAAADAGAMKSAAATTAAKTTAAAMTTVTAANFDRHSFGCVFRYGQRARTCRRQRFGPLLRRGRQHQHRSRRQSRTTNQAARGT